MTLTQEQVMLRDKIAMSTLECVLCAPDSNAIDTLFQDRNQTKHMAPKLAEMCYAIADAMVVARGI